MNVSNGNRDDDMAQARPLQKKARVEPSKLELYSSLDDRERTMELVCLTVSASSLILQRLIKVPFSNLVLAQPDIQQRERKRNVETSHWLFITVN